MMSWLYDLTVSVYAACVCGFFIDFLQTNRKAQRMAFWLLSIVWMLQLSIFVVKVSHTEVFPILTPLDTLFFVSWIIISASLILTRFFKLHFFGFFANIVGFPIMVLTLFQTNDQVAPILGGRLMSDLLVIHITIALLAYAIFAISFILSLMYLVEYTLLKNKKWDRRLIRFDSLTRLEKGTFYCNVLGVPLLLISLILGIIRASTVFTQLNWFDPKIIGSFLVFIAYCYYLYLRLGKNLYGKPLLFWNIIAFLLVLINVFLSEVLTGFHLW
ncbi:HemX protein [Pullulanibacillus pueri]|uniref:Cytochrome c assembly protein n=1 Tax=Pullulanibacillus pueri TaxID=1437324 RepID=A0A8J3A0L1_9BACL|nr:cytochrome c biogenesis protein CcsA [Pullulanibacillus pueri]MBM7684241.1 HemX protein [Pullulanibacillus pueri]GGH89070.1 cytochrome c assembly protein [Pullulanibacillus pueri]